MGVTEASGARYSSTATPSATNTHALPGYLSPGTMEDNLEMNFTKKSFLFISYAQPRLLPQTHMLSQDTSLQEQWKINSKFLESTLAVLLVTHRPSALPSATNTKTGYLS